MWERNDDKPYLNSVTPAPVPPLVEAARDYVDACDQFERLQAQFRKLDGELREVDTKRTELRQRLLEMINGVMEGAPKARSY